MCVWMCESGEEEEEEERERERASEKLQRFAKAIKQASMLECSSLAHLSLSDIPSPPPHSPPLSSSTNAPTSILLLEQEDDAAKKKPFREHCLDDRHMVSW